MSLKLWSPAFTNNGEIPRAHTCDGAGHSPPLSWSDAPAGTKSFALIVDDPDAPDPAAPKGVWVHWVLYNIPGSVTQLPAALTSANFPPGALQGLNQESRVGYAPACPPIGRHRYVHKLYALDTVLPDLKRPRKAALERAMEGHVLERAELVGTYQKPGRS